MKRILLFVMFILVVGIAVPIGVMSLVRPWGWNIEWADFGWTLATLNLAFDYVRSKNDEDSMLIYNYRDSIAFIISIFVGSAAINFAQLTGIPVNRFFSGLIGFLLIVIIWYLLGSAHLRHEIRQIGFRQKKEQLNESFHEQ